MIAREVAMSKHKKIILLLVSIALLLPLFTAAQTYPTEFYIIEVSPNGHVVAGAAIDGVFRFWMLRQERCCSNSIIKVTTSIICSMGRIVRR
jgi:hypothetical protein